MPELPDVEVFKRGLDAKALHQPVASVHVGSRAGRLLHGITPPMLDRKLRGTVNIFLPMPTPPDGWCCISA